MGKGFFTEMIKILENYVVSIVAQFCEYTKVHRSVFLKEMFIIVYESHISEVM